MVDDVRPSQEYNRLLVVVVVDNVHPPRGFGKFPTSHSPWLIGQTRNKIGMPGKVKYFKISPHGLHSQANCLCYNTLAN